MKHLHQIVLLLSLVIVLGEFWLNDVLTCRKGVIGADNSTWLERFDTLKFFRERRDSYYAINTEYIRQIQEVESSGVKIRINVTVDAVRYSLKDLSKLRIPSNQYDLIITNKGAQYRNLNEVQSELSNMVSLTSIGFSVTQDSLTAASLVGNLYRILIIPLERINVFKLSRKVEYGRESENDTNIEYHIGERISSKLCCTAYRIKNKK